MKAIFPLTLRLDWRNAVGQVLITAMGVLLALAASDWSERRTRREFELVALTEIHTALVNDHQALQRALLRMQRLDGSLPQLRDLLIEKPPYNPSMDALFGLPYSFSRIVLNDGAYESLKSLGIDLVEDPVLRTAIANFYEVELRNLEDVAYIEENVLWEVVRPFYLRNFRSLQFERNATPLDYAKLVSDHEYLNIVEYKLTAIRSTWIPRFESSITTMRLLVDLLETELNIDGPD